MKANRRDFLKKAALGTAALSTGAGIKVFGAQTNNSVAGKPNSSPASAFPGWESSFDERTSTLTLKNGEVILKGQVSFASEKGNYTPAGSRDRLKNKYTLLDPSGSVQGYFEVHPDGGNVKIFVYHRSAQAFTGTFSYSGKLSFIPGSFACKTRPQQDERVLSLSTGKADSLLNDSVFAPDTDTALRLDADTVKLLTEGSGSYSFTISGSISQAASNTLSVNLEKDYFRNRYVPYYKPLDRKRCPKAPTGWMSWNTYFDQATADDNLNEAKIGKKYLQPFGCDIWHIESWQGNSDKLPVRNFYNMNLETSEKKFPKGMKKLADDIKKLGFKPGIWMAPFATGNKDFYEAHKDWFVHDKNGKPISCWNGHYTVDPTNPDALAHLRHIHEVASKEWGYEYFKIDGMSGAGPSYGAHFYERPDVRAQLKDPSDPNPYETCLKAFREAIGADRIWLACGGHTTGPDVLYVDAARIGADVVHPDQPVVWAGVYDQGRCTLNRIYTNNIVGYTDPDTLLVHDLPIEEARVATTVVALPGQLTFFADKLGGLTEERMKLLQQTLPVVDVLPVNLYPFYSMLPVWNLNVKNSMLGDYNVVALFNWADEKANISFKAAEAGMDADSECIAYEFWTGKSLGSMKGNFGMEVPAHAVRLLAIHQKKNTPQWISSDRHVAQNGMELKDYKWNEAAKSINGKISLVGGFPLTMKVYVPDNYNMGNAECKGVKITSAKEDSNILAITYLAAKTGDYEFGLKF